MSPRSPSGPQSPLHPAQSLRPTDRAHLRSRLSELNILIAALTAERDALQAESDAIVYPVLSLPPEITTEIFQRCVRHPAVHSPLEAPLLFTQICHQWREIALGSPELWQSLSFIRRAPVEVLQTWLPRSGDLPLDCTFHCKDVAAAGPMLKASLQHSRRWRDIDLGIPLASFPELRLDEVEFPILRKISFGVTKSTSEDFNSLAIALRKVPSLREAHICILPHVTFNLPWHQLWTLTLHVMPIGDCLSLLAGCPQLRHLSVATMGVAVPHSPDLTVTLSNLESLTVDASMAMVENTALLEHLTLPQLRKLVITLWNMVPHHVTPLAALTQRSAFPLHAFELTVGSISRETFHFCLAALPDSTAHLTVTWGAGLHSQFTSLAEPGMLPHLACLILRGGRLTDEQCTSLVDALDARRGMSMDLSLTGFTRLEDAQGIFKGGLLARMRALASEGMKIRVVISGSAHSKEVLVDSLT
ncbi:hypothetical protein FB45DRAFT_790842 [Roridomyces roridus]|uniref:F-box domain-containing protein n=1 Tax=Roridomyces roridus TaxID=1738132 RepID=A0AAD7C068_9AGAR|nr:hypothetical protein FB45DRAFT_790842 [Roridomyces roridus]